MKKQPNDVQSLGVMLRYRRPAGSRTEKKFIKDHLLPLGMNIDKYGNLYKRIGDSPVLWSCHTDTVHKAGGKQQVLYSDGTFKVFDRGSNCLGADDTAGVWLMTQMIEAKVPGLYVFHRAEEVGGKGSDHFVKHNKEMLKGIEYAIAFDRAGTDSIITHQMWQRCCSEDFSTSFAKELGMKHKSDDGGTFTDTANYVDDVGECTNLSIGYKHQHRETEELNAKYLFELRDALFDFNYKNLTSKRKPGEVEWKYRSYGGYHGSDFWEDYYYGGHFVGEDNELAGYINRNGILIPVNSAGKELFNHRAIVPKKSGEPDVPIIAEEKVDSGEENTPLRPSNTLYGGYERLVQIIRDNPREVADFLEESGISADDLGYAVYQRGGYLRNSSISTWRGHNMKGKQ